MLLLLLLVAVVSFHELAAYHKPSVSIKFKDGPTAGKHRMKGGQWSTPCKKPISRIIYIKTMKTGSSTLTNILYR